MLFHSVITSVRESQKNRHRPNNFPQQKATSLNNQLSPLTSSQVCLSSYFPIHGSLGLTQLVATSAINTMSGEDNKGGGQYLFHLPASLSLHPIHRLQQILANPSMHRLAPFYSAWPQKRRSKKSFRFHFYFQLNFILSPTPTSNPNPIPFQPKQAHTK